MSGETVSIESFFIHVRDSNPFMVNRITDPSQADSDVSSIHQAEFEQLTSLVKSACRTPLGFGALLLGDAGIGKSHLISRVCHWADQEGAFYVFLHNLQSTPERIPRYILKCILNRLLKGKDKGYHNTPLFKLVQKTLQPYLRESEKDRQWTDMLAAYRQEIAQIMDSDGHSSSPYDHTIYDVIFRFFVSARLAKENMKYKKREEEKTKLALAWLEGDFIDNTDAKKLGLSPPQDAEDVCSLEDDEAVSRVIVALAHFSAKHDLPLILFFDQVDNLQEAQIKSLSIFIHALLDNTPNLLVVTSGVQSTLLNFKSKGVIPVAAWDRIASEEIMLKPIVANDAKKLIKSRLESFIKPFAKLPKLSAKLKKDSLFPVGHQWFEKQIEERIDFRPREIINLAKSRFTQEQTALKAAKPEGDWLKNWPSGQTIEYEKVPIEPLIDATVEQKRQAQILQRKLDPSGLPPDAPNLCGLTQTLLQQCVPDASPKPYTLRKIKPLPATKAGRKLPYHLHVEEERPDDKKKIINGLTFVVTQSKNSASWALRRIHESLNGTNTPDHAILVTDERQPLAQSLGKTGEKYFNTLKAQQEKFEHFELTFEQYVGLDALQTVIGEARSGDVEVDLPDGTSVTLSAEDVIASYHRQDIYHQHPLLCELLTEKPIGISKPEHCDVDKQKTREYIVRQLAFTMGMSSLELTNRFLSHKKLSEDQRDKCHEALKNLCIEMDKAEMLHATPMGDQLSLMYRSR